MTDRLIIQAVDDNYAPFLDIAEMTHRYYANRMRAHYHAHRKVPWLDVHPSWVRLPLVLDALRSGYRQVLWLDADSLVIDPDVNIFSAVPDEPPLYMTEQPGSRADWPQGPIDSYNDGVLLVNGGLEATRALEWVWNCRHEVVPLHHDPCLWQLNWIMDYVVEHPHVVGNLPARFNWMYDDHATQPKGGAVIQSWHGVRHPERLDLFRAAHERVYG